MTDHLTITEVAAHLGLEADTLRYYERHGVVPPPSRDTAGRRCYAPSDVHLLEVLMHLKQTGMPLAHIAEFTAWVSKDPAGVPERLALLQEHRSHVINQIARWQQSLAIIDRKINDYSERGSQAQRP